MYICLMCSNRNIFLTSTQWLTLAHIFVEVINVTRKHFEILMFNKQNKKTTIVLNLNVPFKLTC